MRGSSCNGAEVSRASQRTRDQRAYTEPGKEIACGKIAQGGEAVGEYITAESQRGVVLDWAAEQAASRQMARWPQDREWLILSSSKGCERIAARLRVPT